MSVEQLEAPQPAERTFRSAEGRTTTLRILEQDLIAKGGNGNIYRILAHVPGAGGKDRATTFVLKEFIEYPNLVPLEKKNKALQQLANRAMHTYQLLREAKVTTWTTHRIEARDGTSILMTDGELAENDYLITANNSSRSLEQLETMVESITNLDAAIEESMREAERAAAAGIFVPGDAWMFRFRVHNGTAELKAFPGDFDCVATSASAKLTYKNLLELFGAFLESLYFIPGETLATYKTKIKERFLVREPTLAEEL